MKASFIMPLYDQQCFVAESICGIIKQTEPDFELIIVDDASTDAGYEAAKAYADIDSRIRLYQNEENQNSTKTYNVAASYAKGRYIAITSSDDVYEPTYLEKALAADADVVYTQYVIVDSDGKVVMEPYDDSDFMYSYDRLKKECYLFAGSMLVRRAIWENLEGYDESFLCASDWDFSIRACRGHHIALIPEPLVKYRNKHVYSNRFRIAQAVRTREKERIGEKYG
jgi:glycosyltransferase involved in cell wall biosynthesis